MGEELIRIADPKAIEELRSQGARVLHRFQDKAVVADPLARSIRGTARAQREPFRMPDRPDLSKIEELAYSYRQTPEFKAAKQNRPARGADIDSLVNETPLT